MIFHLHLKELKLKFLQIVLLVLLIGVLWILGNHFNKTITPVINSITATGTNVSVGNSGTLNQTVVINPERTFPAPYLYPVMYLNQKNPNGSYFARFAVTVAYAVGDSMNGAIQPISDEIVCETIGGGAVQQMTFVGSTEKRLGVVSYIDCVSNQPIIDYKNFFRYIRTER